MKDVWGITKSKKKLDEYNACLNAHGLYNSSQFVLRLSPLVHEALEEIEKPGIVYGAENPTWLQAMSTYLHETIHWWQHVGSYHGLFRSLSYPCQATAHHSRIVEMQRNGELRKPVHSICKLYPFDPHISHAIWNDFFDVDSFLFITHSKYSADQRSKEQMYSGVKNTVYQTQRIILGMIEATLRKPTNLISFHHVGPFARKENEEPNCGIGVLEIFEGQARLNQLLYLGKTSQGMVDVKEFGKNGMFDGVYGKAFQFFLKNVQENWPNSIISSVVAVFLLICDFALNPTNSFSTEKAFEKDMDFVNLLPGNRFEAACNFFQKNKKYLETVIQYSSKEYWALMDLLNEHIAESSLRENLTEISVDFSPDGELSDLFEGYCTMNFDYGNFVIKSVYSHFLAYSVDKLSYPHLFCWAGFHMVESGEIEKMETLFKKHCSLFHDGKDDKTIFVCERDGVSNDVMAEFQNRFFSDMVVVDLVTQCISVSGDFVYDLTWLAPKQPREKAVEYMTGNFESAFGFPIENINING